ncbi:hypothetical protein [Hyphomonas sp.]|uniref:hypothetical protein n=1 Tax=Hyphomonas sp. TaxID=87 RepID=UPI00391AC315
MIRRALAPLTLAALMAPAAAAETPPAFSPEPVMCAALYLTTFIPEGGSLFGGNEADIDFPARVTQIEEDYGVYFEEVDYFADGISNGRYGKINTARRAAMLIACDHAFGFDPVLAPAE